KTIIFRLMDKEMYFAMRKDSQNLVVDRGIALHKMIRLVTAATAGDGYLNFMGNEFGHPEWIDFPREGNGWSFKYARRQWSLPDNPDLRYGGLEAFDAAMVRYFRSKRILSEPPEIIYADEEKKVLLFKRKSRIFALNFNPTGSFVDYAFDCPRGTYEVVLSTDERAFGGFGRVTRGERHESLADGRLSIYLPSRTAFVLEKKRK
ncbi:MAG: alpha amylase C-terminal domain-containing protein, partial [Bacteroidales bacterium]|nr:alpha amylase C-terminal domain-containing protein [Bacteroidales bacterium]